MSNTITGTVQAITPTNGVSKRTGKPYTIWTATIDGNEVKAGFKKPGFEVGQNVSVEVNTNKWGDVEMVTPGTPTYSKPTMPSASSGGGAPAGRTFPVNKTSPEMSIIRQNALTNANAAVNNYYEFSTLDTGEIGSLDEYLEKVIETAYKFTDFSSGQREVKAVERMGK